MENWVRLVGFANLRTGTVLLQKGPCLGAKGSDSHRAGSQLKIPHINIDFKSNPAPIVPMFITQAYCCMSRFMRQHNNATFSQRTIALLHSVRLLNQFGSPHFTRAKIFARIRGFSRRFPGQFSTLISNLPSFFAHLGALTSVF